MKKLFVTLLFVFAAVLVVSRHLNAKDNAATASSQAELPFVLPDCVSGAEVGESSSESFAQERLASLEDEVQWLLKRKETDLAYRKLLQELQRDYTPELSQLALRQFKDHLDKLARHCAKPAHCNKQFIVPKHGFRRKKDLQTRQQVFQLLSKKEILACTEQFDLMRDALAAYLRLVDDQYLHDQDREITRREAILNCKAQALALKKKLIKTRGCFISERVITPYLCETEKLLFLARGKWWTLGKADYKQLRKSVLLLSHAFHTKWLYESTEETRFHFLKVYKNLKSKSKKREWEEFIVLATLADSFDPSKYRGPVAWWSDTPDRH